MVLAAANAIAADVRARELVASGARYAGLGEPSLRRVRVVPAPDPG